MTPGSFLTLSGAIVLVSFSVYDLWLERILGEVGRRRRLQDVVDLSTRPQVAARFGQYGVSSPFGDRAAFEVVCDQSTDVLDDMSAYCDWLAEGRAGQSAKRIQGQIDRFAIKWSGLARPSVGPSLDWTDFTPRRNAEAGAHALV